jgi:predicted MFS family arabinose efflux permease
MLALVLGGAMLFAYNTMFLVGNVGLTMDEVPYLLMCGGLATLVTVPAFGWLADRFGKLPVFRVMATITVVPILLMSNLPPVPFVVAVAVTTLFMVTSSGRMVPAQALITACAEPRRRGSFLSVVASVQQIVAAAASVVGGLIIGKAAAGEGLSVEGSPEPIPNYHWVGVVSAAFTLLSVVLAGYLRPAAQPSPVVSTPAPAAEDAVAEEAPAGT